MMTEPYLAAGATQDMALHIARPSDCAITLKNIVLKIL